MQKNKFEIDEKGSLQEIYTQLGIYNSEADFVFEMYKEMKELKSNSTNSKEYYNKIREKIITDNKFQTLFFVCLSRANSCWPWTLFRRALGIEDNSKRSIFKTFEIIINHSVDKMTDDYIFAECITIYLIHTTKELWEYLALETKEYLTTEGTTEEIMKEHISYVP